MCSGTAWTLQALGIPAPDAEGLKPTPPEALERELQHLLGVMQEGADDVGSEP